MLLLFPKNAASKTKKTTKKYLIQKEVKQFNTTTTSLPGLLDFLIFVAFLI